MAGFIVLHRKIKDWEWYQDANTFRVFVHLLLEANHENRKWRGIIVKRGQCIISYKKLSSELNLSVRNIRTAIKHLKSTSEVTSEVTSEYTLITVENYNKYQDKKSESDKQSDKRSDKQVTSDRQASDKQVTTNNNETIKQLNNVNNNIYSPATQDVAAAAIEHLNQIAGTNYTVQAKATIKHINARLNEGATLDDFITVIDNKASDWLDNPKMRDYLRPQTLFGTKFESYLNQKRMQNNANNWDDSNGELI